MELSRNFFFLIFQFNIQLIIFFSLSFSVTPHIAKVEPSFISRSETFKFIAGKTIQLPCDVANVGESKSSLPAECHMNFCGWIV